MRRVTNAVDMIDKNGPSWTFTTEERLERLNNVQEFVVNSGSEFLAHWHAGSEMEGRKSSCAIDSYIRQLVDGVPNSTTLPISPDVMSSNIWTKNHQ